MPLFARAIILISIFVNSGSAIGQSVQLDSAIIC